MDPSPYYVGYALGFIAMWTVIFLAITLFLSPFIIIAAIFAARRPRR